eukprot:683863-Alexandrium_andersonii.AAC.1
MGTHAVLRPTRSCYHSADVLVQRRSHISPPVMSAMPRFLKSSSHTSSGRALSPTSPGTSCRGCVP